MLMRQNTAMYIMSMVEINSAKDIIQSGRVSVYYVSIQGLHPYRLHLLAD